MSPVSLALPNSMQLHLHPNTVTSPYFTETGGRWIGLRIFVTGALILIFYRKEKNGLYSKMQASHHQKLKVSYQYYKLYKEPFEPNETVSIHQPHLRILVIKVYKTTSYLNPLFM